MRYLSMLVLEHTKDRYTQKAKIPIHQKRGQVLPLHSQYQKN